MDFLYEIDASKVEGANKDFYHVRAKNHRQALEKFLDIIGKPELFNFLIWKLTKIVRSIEPEIEPTKPESVGLHTDDSVTKIKGVEDAEINADPSTQLTVDEAIGKRAISEIFRTINQMATKNADYRAVMRIIENGEEVGVKRGDWKSFDEAEEEVRLAMQEKELNRMIIGFVEDFYGNQRPVQGQPVEGSSYGPEVRDQHSVDHIKERPTGSGVVKDLSDWITMPKRANYKKLSWRD